MQVDYEVTDTFGGEANYAWVKRETEEYDPQHVSKGVLVRHIKRMMGVTGDRCDVQDMDDQIIVRPVGKNAPCIVGFISLTY